MLKIAKRKYFKDLGYMVDCSRGAVANVGNLKKLIDILSDFGYDYLMLYTEDVYEIEGEPYFGYMRGRYSASEIKEIDEYCQSKNMELRACIQTLAHMGRLLRHDQYKSLFEINDIFTVKDEKVYEFIDKMLNAVSKMFSCKKIHIGMDEAWALGRGKYLDLHGQHSKTEIMAYHLQRVAEIAKKYGFICDIWGDMLYSSYMESEDKEHFHIDMPDIITAFSWRYWKRDQASSEEEFKIYKKITNGQMGFAGGAQKWGGFVPGNTYSMQALDEQVTSCLKFKVDRLLLTAWGDGGADASLFSTLPTIFYCSLLAHKLKLNRTAKKYFLDVVGMKFDDFMIIDKLGILDSKDPLTYNNLSFIYLYNDLLQGLFDEAVLPNATNLLNDVAILLKKNIKNDKFGYIFKTLYSLAKLTAIKAPLSINIYNHYKASDKQALANDINDIKTTIKLLDIFLHDFEIQWHKENKSFGFEKQIIRLGGLKERLNYTIRQINRYLLNEITKIDELEEERLPISVSWWDHNNQILNNFNGYKEIVSAGSLREL